jgi:hypothetical protein
MLQQGPVFFHFTFSTGHESLSAGFLQRKALAAQVVLLPPCFFILFMVFTTMKMANAMIQRTGDCRGHDARIISE